MFAPDDPVLLRLVSAKVVLAGGHRMFFFEIVAVSQILKTLEIIDITTSTASVQPTGFYCFAYKVKILMILTYPNSSLMGK